MDSTTVTADRLTQSLRQLVIAMARSDRKIADSVGLNTSDLMCVGFIQSAAGPVTPKMLSDYVGMSTGSTTALIDRLERRGLLVRQRHPSDRRGVVLELDNDAMAASGILELQARFRQVLAKVTGAMSAGDAESLRLLLEGIVAELEAM